MVSTWGPTILPSDRDEVQWEIMKLLQRISNSLDFLVEDGGSGE
jgi:hypothetical protein